VSGELAADSVGKAFGARRVLSSATLAVEPGAVTLLAGRNGAGKSTLLRILAGMLAPDHGTVRFRGRVMDRAHLHRLAAGGVFYLRDGSLLSPRVPLRAHMDAVEGRFGVRGAEEVAARLEITGLLDALPTTFSGGERRRASLALALLRGPAFLLADEPLRGVAPRDAEVVLVALRDLAGRGCGVVMTGHELSLLLPASDRVVWVTAGTTYPFATRDDALRDPRFRREFLGVEEEAPSASSSPGPRVPVPLRVPARPSASSPPPSPVPMHASPPASARPSPAGTAGRTAGAAPGTMQVDAQTLRDLEVFEAPGGVPSLFDLLDHTRTRGGRTRLRQRFARPLASPASIRETQAAVAFARAHPGLFAELPAEERLRELDAYLRSPHAPPRARGGIALAAESLWCRLADRRLFDATVAGVEAALSFLRSVRVLAAGLRERGAPGPLGHAAGRLAALLATEELAVLGTEEGRVARPWEVLAADVALRERMQGTISKLLDELYEVDAIASMAAAGRALGLTMPRIAEAEDGVLEIRAGWHPFVQGAVPNDLALPPGKRLLFLTGPNMAGKTTYMRAAAVCVYLAQVGMEVPAAEMALSPFGAMLASLNTADNTRLGYSYFFSEVKRVREAAKRLEEGRRSLLLFDEMFKGTNVRDAFDGSRAVVSAFAAVEGSVALVSSHLVELVEELRAEDGIEMAYFDAQVRDGTLVYDYRLKPGHSSQRLGMVLLEREGLLASLERLRANRRSGP
jgi:ABC-type multidrug transport system ATPase subunit